MKVQILPKYAKIWARRKLMEVWGYSQIEAEKRVSESLDQYLKINTDYTNILDVTDVWVEAQGLTGIEKHFREVGE